MSNSQILTDEQAAAIWSGDTTSILNFDEQGGGNASPDNNIPEDPKNSQDNPDPKPTLVDDDELSGVWREGEEDDEEEDQPDPKNQQPQNNNQPQSKDQPEPESRKGRKPADLVNLVNQLVEEEVLFGYEQGDIKTIEEAKELIKENLKYKEETAFDNQWKKKVESYSPQVQAILHYAEKGGQDISPLLSAIAEVEKSSDINVEEEKGQEEVVRQVLKLKGFDEDEIKDQIDTLKDLDRLKAKAQKFLPELNKMKEQRIQLMMQEQEERDLQAKEAARVYLQTIQETLDKDQVGSLKLKREDKYKIMEALAVPKYRSLNGFQVNEFVKTLEELQFGKNADYEHFLNLVHYAVDKKGFLEKVKESIKEEVSADTLKKLKTAKSTGANSPQNLETEPTRKNVIKNSGFRNPYSK